MPPALSVIQAPLPELCGRHTQVFLDKLAKEEEVGEAQPRRNLLDRLVFS